MRVLLLGGSWFLGRLIINDFARRGFDVTVFNRGRSSVPPSNGVRYVHGDRERDDDLHTLVQSGPWDVVVDVSGKVPAIVRRSVQALAGVAKRYVSVSTVRVYRDWPNVPVDEDSALWPGDPDHDPGTRTWNPDTYGPLKAGCEIACREAFGDDRLLLLRLHEMIGEYEYVGPLRSWLERMRRGGPVLVPGPDRAIQPIDVRDVACFLVDQVQRGATGVFNVAAPEGRTYSALLQSCAGVTAAGSDDAPELVWADQDWLVDQGVQQWTELPLWRNAAAHWSVSNDRAVEAGLQCRPLAQTIANTWQWLKSEGQPADHPRSTGYGMDPARESAIIARWRARAALPGESQRATRTYI
jgi:nucleoside-diphosphate-sugar epimerase